MDNKDAYIEHLENTIVNLNETINGLQNQISNLTEMIMLLRKEKFGSSSEKYKVPFPGQMNLFQEELPDDRIPELIEPEIIEVASHKRARKAKATYEEMFDHLPHRQVVLNTLSDEEKHDLEYRKAQLQRLKEEVVDIEEMATGISIMDLGLNEFRLDLLEYAKNHPEIN